MAPRGFLLVGGLSVMVPCVYFLCLPDMVFYIRVTGQLIQLRPGRSFYFVVLGGIFYISYINQKKETDSGLEHGDNIPAHKRNKEKGEKEGDDMCDKMFEEKEKETRINDKINASNEVLESRRETRCECIG